MVELAEGETSVAGSTPPPRRRALTAVGLIAILLLAFVLRAWNLDWDRGGHLQPDERFWSSVAAYTEAPDDWSFGEVLDPERSPLNPRSSPDIEHYVYGTLPLWASESAAAVLMTDRMSWMTAGIDSLGIDLVNEEPADAPIGERLRFNTAYNVTIIGRLMSALVDTGTVLLVFFLARELGGRRSGLLAALLQSLTVLHIQYSHFLGSEPWVAFFVTATVWGSVRLARGHTDWATRLLTAAALGAAIGSKLNGIAAAVAPAVALLVAIAPDLRRIFSSRIPHGVVGRIARRIEPYLVMGIVAVAAYRIAQPYEFNAGVSLVLNERFFNDVTYLEDINSGGNWPWVQPLVGARPLWHPLKQMFLWGMGPGLGAASILGLGRAVWRFKQGERYWAVPLAVVGAYFALVSLQFYAIVRYLQPTYPTLVALGAVALIAAWRWAASVASAQPALAAVARVGVALAVGSTIFWGLAFVNGVYNNDNARLAAGDWMLENLPSDAVVSQQAWDDGLPWANPGPFGRVTLEPFSFGGDEPERIELLIDGLDQVDYVIESSNKFYDSLPKTPARFPQMSRYYETLFDGTLGFELVRTFQNQPSLLGITIDDSSAEEAFTLYDHPTVHIWQKTDAFSVDHAYALLNPDRARQAINADPRDAGANAGMLRPATYLTQQQGASFADVHSNDTNSVVAALLWFVVFQTAAFAVTPLVVRLAGSSAAAAYGLTKPAGLLALALPVWLMVSWGWFEMSRSLVWVTFLGLSMFGLVTARRWQSSLQALWRDHRRLVIAGEVVFIGAFLAVVVIRALNPDLWHPWRGGEKPMELAYFTAVTGSATMPPYDPWFAGGALNYYYLGWFFLAVPTRLLGLFPDIGFNLGVATYAAVAAATVFATAALLADVANRRTPSRMPRARTGAFAVLLFLVIGNLDGFRQLVKVLRERLPAFTPGGLRDLSLRYDWWDPSRVNKNSVGAEVTEFPNFTVLFADLHPHFMAMGFFGLMLAACAGYIERGRQGNIAAMRVMVVVLGVLTGVLRMVHTWDFPTALAASGGAVVLGAVIANGPALWRLRTALLHLVALGIVHQLITAPYRAANQVADSGFGRSESTTNLDDFVAHWGLFLMIAAVYTFVRIRSLAGELDADEIGLLGVVAGAVGIFGLIVVHVVVGSVAAWMFAGLVAAIVLVWVEAQRIVPSSAHLMVAAMWTLGIAVLMAVEIFTQNADVARLNTVFKFWLQVWHLFSLSAAFSAVWALRHWRVAVGSPAMADSDAQVRRVAPDHPGAHVPEPTSTPSQPGGIVSYASMVAGGGSLTSQSATADVVSPIDDPLLAMPSVVVPAPAGFVPPDRVAPPIAGESAEDSDSGSQADAADDGFAGDRDGGPVGRRVFAGALAILLLASLVYPVLSVFPRVSNRVDTAQGPSLRGTLWLEPGHETFRVKDPFGAEVEVDPGRDRAVIDWLRANVEGRPTIVEGVGGSEYQWWGRISIHTGLPTVLGWRWHQDQQRTLFNASVNQRKADVADFYTAATQADIDRFLRSYDVSYVVVGALEAAVASPETLELFRTNPSLQPAWTNGDLAVYRVTKSTLVSSRSTVELGADQ